MESFYGFNAFFVVVCILFPFDICACFCVGACFVSVFVCLGLGPLGYRCRIPCLHGVTSSVDYPSHEAVFTPSVVVCTDYGTYVMDSRSSLLFIDYLA